VFQLYQEKPAKRWVKDGAQTSYRPSGDGSAVVRYQTQAVGRVLLFRMRLDALEAAAAPPSA